MTAPRTEAGRALLEAMDRNREGFRVRTPYTSQAAAAQDALAFEFAFIVQPALGRIESEAARIDPERLARAVHKTRHSNADPEYDMAEAEKRAAAIAAAYGADR